jgi:hypothetical protein
MARGTIHDKLDSRVGGSTIGPGSSVRSTSARARLQAKLAEKHIDLVEGKMNAVGKGGGVTKASKKQKKTQKRNLQRRLQKKKAGMRDSDGHLIAAQSSAMLMG